MPRSDIIEHWSVSIGCVMIAAEVYVGRTLLFLTLFALGAAPAGASAPADARAWLQGHRAARSAWVNQLPSRYRRDSLFRDLSGVSSEPEWLIVGGRRELHLRACRPHECLTGADLLFSPSDGRLVGMISVFDWDANARRADPVGPMTAAERRCLTSIVYAGVGQIRDGGC